jgi:DNA modification methylase
MNVIYNEDCRKTLAVGSPLYYDYIFTSPPDFNELGMEPTQAKDYIDFLHSVFSLCKLNTAITLAFTDRKFDSGIISKSSMAIGLFQDLGWKLKSHKIWVKSEKIDLFRLTYANVLTFTFGNCQIKQQNHNDFKPDVWADGWYRGAGGFTNSLPQKVAERCILNFTALGQTVYNPFMGIGQTAIACIATGRNYIGSELSSEVYDIARKRIEEYNASFTT